jgi:LPXTG-site transpeptidase (sortase) family protein
MRRSTAISALVGALLLVGSPAVWYLTQPASSVGDLEAFDASPTTAVDEPPAATSPDEPAQTFTISELRGPLVTIAPPDRIAIPAIGVDAPIVPVALEPDGTMEIPENVATIGWFEPGVRPGQRGSAVLSGHVDSRTQGRGAFFDLEDLDVGDEVTIATTGGPQRWQVAARQRFAKNELPIAELFTREGDPRLVLITCGGEFDAGARSYSDNVVVIAVPA